ncbi:MAG: STAS/SEC14 domain-containing protein [Methylococcales bacterium]|nr:STAS/SEC14 domain-containing protein [Methylococcales bacterium]
MAYQVLENDGAFLSFHISGQYNLADQEAMQALAAHVIGIYQHVSILALIDHFDGWEPNANWDDYGFMQAHGDDVKKMAIVADEQWKEQAFLFVGKGFRETEIEFFPLSALTKAQQWVRSV